MSDWEGRVRGGMRYVKCEMVNLNSRKVLGDAGNESCRLLYNFSKCF